MPDVINAGDKAVSTKVEGSSLSASSIDMTDFKEIKSQQTQAADATKPPVEGLATDDELLKQMFSIGLPQNKEINQALNQVLDADKRANGESMSGEDAAANAIDNADKQVDSRENLGDVALRQGSPSLALMAYEDAFKTVQDNPAANDAGTDLLDKLGKLGISEKQVYEDLGVKTGLDLSNLDANDNALRETFKDGAPAQPQEHYAFKSVVEADSYMQAVQLAVATGQTDGTLITGQLSAAADFQINTRVGLGDTCALNGHNKEAIGSYLSALKMQLNNAFSAGDGGSVDDGNVDDANVIYEKLAKLGVSKAVAIKAVDGAAEPNAVNPADGAPQSGE